MGKAIIVTDMAECCEKCHLIRLACDGERWACSYPLSNHCLHLCEDDYKERRPDWCPLKEIPEKGDIGKAKTLTVLNWIEGFNACIDAILNGGK